MSTRAPYFRCSYCSFGGGFAPIEEWRYKLTDGRTGAVPTAVSFCRTCNDVRVTEDLPTPSAARHRVWATESLAGRYRLAEREMSATAGEFCRALAARIKEDQANAALVRDVVMIRSVASNRCLTCGSTDVVLPVFDTREEPAPNDAEEPTMVIPHPGCPGVISQRDEDDPDGLRADWTSHAVHFSAEGLRIKD